MALTNLLSKADELKTEINQLRPISSEQERRIMDKFRLEWNFHSNAIEGNRLTLGETKTFLLEGLTAQGKPLKDHLDIKGHDEVITFLEDFIRRKESLTEVVIRGMHKILLREPYQVQATTLDGGITSKWIKLGEYKSEPNYVKRSQGEIHHFVLPQDTPAKMGELMNWFRSESEKKEHPLIVAAIFHHRFTQIHPFDDGNGRMARILMNLILMQNGFLPIILRTERRDQYFAALMKADEGEQEEFITLLAEEELWSQELFLRGARGEDISDFDDIDKRIALLKQELRHIEEPEELTLEVQRQLFTKCLLPFVSRLLKKVGQFDDLFSKTGSSLSGKIWQLDSILPWRPPNDTTRNQFISVLDQAVNSGGKTFHSIQMGFTWEGFKKAGLNTFTTNFDLHFEFQKHKYIVNSNYHEGVRYENVYQNPMSETDISKRVNLLTEFLFKNIENQRRKK